jgi:hypothetical protein
MYDDLIERILYAQEEMLKHCVEANTVVINGKKYGELAADIQWAMFHDHTPTIVGLAAEVADLPDDWDFIVQNRVYPPLSLLDQTLAENKRLKQKLANLKAMMEEE